MILFDINSHLPVSILYLYYFKFGINDSLTKQSFIIFVFTWNMNGLHIKLHVMKNSHIKQKHFFWFICTRKYQNIQKHTAFHFPLFQSNSIMTNLFYRFHYKQIAEQHKHKWVPYVLQHFICFKLKSSKQQYEWCINVMHSSALCGGPWRKKDE